MGGTRPRARAYTRRTAPGGGEPSRMRNRELHGALREFALEAAAQLTADIEGGAELPYDVVEEPGTGSVLYRYLPLTSDFIAERWDVLRTIPSRERAAATPGD